jgi:hypothetical protein
LQNSKTKMIEDYHSGRTLKQKFGNSALSGSTRTSTHGDTNLSTKFRNFQCIGNNATR